MHIQIAYFSGTGQSRSLAQLTADYLKEHKVEINDLTSYQQRAHLDKIKGDQVILIFPVYGSEAPQALKDFFGKLKGQGMPVILIALWGKCHKTNAIYHMATIMQENGFVINGGIEIGAKHSYTEKEFPISFQLEKIENYYHYLEEHLGRKESVRIYEEKQPFIEKVMCSLPEGTFPRLVTKVALKKEACMKCGACIKMCPNQAIGEDYQISEKRCIRCGSCVTRCPYGARKLKVMKAARKILLVHMKDVSTKYYE